MVATMVPREWSLASGLSRGSLGCRRAGVALLLPVAGRTDPDGLDVHELVHAQVGELAPVTALLDPAEGQLRIAGDHAVDERQAGGDVADERAPLVLVLAPEVAAEPVGVAVGDADRKSVV